MEIILAKQAGFCFGVKRATQMAFEAAGKGEKTFTLGPIIHSPQVVQKLEQMGVKVIQNISEQETGTIIIRSHGVAAEEVDEAVRKALEIVDATCPFVKKAQEHVKSLSQAGYDVVVVGDADHPEVQGIVSYAKGKVYVVGSGEEAARLPRMAKIGVVAQTTQSFENLKNVVLECLTKGGEIRVFHTICDATAVRQEEAKALAKFKDLPGIVPFLDFFRANGTGYIVMDYVDGDTLRTHLRDRGERISFDEALTILSQVMNALEGIHQARILHRDCRLSSDCL